MTTGQVLWSVLGPFCKLVVLFGSVAGIVLGLGLLLQTQATLRGMARLNRWVSSRRALKALEIPRSMARRARGGRLWAGLVIASGAAYVLIALVWHFDTAGLASPLMLVGLEALRWILVAGSVLAAIVGMLLAFSPRTLEAFETWSNRWVSMRQAVQGADTMYTPLERLVEQFPRAAGGLLIAFSAAAAIASVVLLLQR